MPLAGSQAEPARPAGHCSDMDKRRIPPASAIALAVGLIAIFVLYYLNVFDLIAGDGRG